MISGNGKLRSYWDSLTRRDLTGGSIAKNIWILAIPMMVTSFSHTIFDLTDIYWVSRLGSDAIAAVTLGGGAMMILLTPIMGIMTGTRAMVARFIGAKDSESANMVAMQSLIVDGLVTLALGGIGFVVTPILLELLGAEPEVVSLGTWYIRIVLLGAIGISWLYIIGSILDGAGDAWTPMIIMVGSFIANMIIDPVLIFGLGVFPKMGVNGAALASVISGGIGAAVALYVLGKGKSRIKIGLDKLGVNLGIIWQMIKIGVPNSLEMTIFSIRNVVLLAIVTGYGTSALAAYGIGIRVPMMAMLFSVGLSSAAATLVGQNLGAEKPERAEKSAWLATGYSGLIMGITAVTLLSLADPIVRTFDKDLEVIKIGSEYLRITVLGYIFIACGTVLRRALNGAGDTVSPMIITLAILGGLHIPLALMLPRVVGLGVTGVWWATLISFLMQGIVLAGWFRLGRWKQKRISIGSQIEA